MSNRERRSGASQPATGQAVEQGGVRPSQTPEPRDGPADADSRIAEIGRALRGAPLAPADEPSFVFRPD